MQDSTHSAIQAALSRNWKKAISINQTILEQNSNDLDAMNRLAYGYVQTDNIEEAKKIYCTVLSLDRYNIIAQKNLDKINALPKKNKKSKNAAHAQTSISPSLFIEELGKTKTVNLIHAAPANVLSCISTGDLVKLFPKRHSIEVRDYNNTYLGALPDDIAFRLLPFIRAGNVYQVCIKNVAKNSISIFICEIKRCKRFLYQSSFITAPSEVKHLLHKDTETQKPEEEE